jgi:dCTP deaminase
MILTDREIQIFLDHGQIRIEPRPDVEVYSSTSVDLRLDRYLSVFKEDLTEAGGVEAPIIDPSHKDYVAERALTRLTDLVEIPADGYPLKPKKLILGWTVERVELPLHSRIAARVEGKSSLARIGLGVHVTAPTIHSGFKYPIRLELINHGPAPIRLRYGMRICQLIFEISFGTPQKGFSAVQSAPLPSTSGRMP